MKQRPKGPLVDAEARDAKPLEFVGTSREDLRAMPKDVSRALGVALFDTQRGGKPGNAKPLKGYRGSGVLEIVEGHDSGTYRAVYTVRFARAIYVLHAFQKKSSQGIRTPARDLALIAQRLQVAEEHYAAHYSGGGEGVRWRAKRRSRWSTVVAMCSPIWASRTPRKSWRAPKPAFGSAI